MKLKSHIENILAEFRKKWGRFYYSDTLGMDWEKPEKTNVTGGIPEKHNGYCIASGDIEKDFSKALSQIAIEAIDNEKENAFDVLMSCMPKSAENINTITPEDARKMLQDFVKKYWQN